MNASPGDEAIQQLLAEANAALEPLQASSGEAQQAIDEPFFAWLARCRTRRTRRLKRSRRSKKPYTDALAGLATARDAQNPASQQQVVAAA
ncbi:MAG: hypothetical protein R3B96_22725 [Pirellulaceae bacterium]